MFNDLDSGVKPQNDTQEKIRDTDLNNVRDIKKHTTAFVILGLDPRIQVNKPARMRALLSPAAKKAGSNNMLNFDRNKIPVGIFYG